MSSIFDLIYREYCRARLAEMRKQLLIPIASDEILEAHRDGGDAGPGDRNSVGTTQPRRNRPQRSSSRDS
jgi:hypothetical protein